MHFCFFRNEITYFRNERGMNEISVVYVARNTAGSCFDKFVETLKKKKPEIKSFFSLKLSEDE